jgi:hypothetical protein
MRAVSTEGAPRVVTQPRRVYLGAQDIKRGNKNGANPVNQQRGVKPAKRCNGEGHTRRTGRGERGRGGRKERKQGRKQNPQWRGEGEGKGGATNAIRN